MNLCKKLTSARAFLFFLAFALCSVGAHAASSEDHETEKFTQARLTAISIYESMIRSLEDRKIAWVEKYKNLDTLSERGIRATHDAHQVLTSWSRDLTVEEQKEKLQHLYRSGIKTATTNLEITRGVLDDLNQMNPDQMREHLGFLIDSFAEVFHDRQQRSDIPLTIPQLIEKYPAHTRDIAENSRIQRWDEAAVLKVLASAFPNDVIDDFFNSKMEDKIFGGCFQVLKAYVLDLIDTPPLPDHWMYRLHKSKFDTVQANREVILNSKGPLSKKSILLRQEKEVMEESEKLLQGPLKELEELELRAQGALAAFYQKQETEVPLEKASQALPKKKKKNKKKKKKKAPGSATVEIVSSETAGLSLPREHRLEEAPSLVQPTITVAELVPTLPQPNLSSAEESSSEEELEKESYDPEPWTAYENKKGTQASSSPSPREEEATATHKVFVKSDIYGLWEHFYRQSTIEWKDFLKMITEIDFGIEPNGGSIHRILYPATFPKLTGRRHVVVHKPHGQFTSLGAATVGFLREAFFKDFGWNLDSFQIKE